MELLKKKIMECAEVLPGDVIKVDSFVNHQIDVELIAACGKEWYDMYKDEGINKILTIEASGIGIACLTALHFDCPVVFAKKTKTNNIYADVYTAEVYSYTHQRSYDIVVSKDFLNAGDRVLIIDDFLAKGSALNALIKLIRDAGATPVGAGIVIEKAFQDGGKLLREQGFRVDSLARIASMSQADGITFVD